MTAGSPQRGEAEWFTAPEQVNQRRYEALRAYFVDGTDLCSRPGARFGYTRWAMINLVREYRAGKLDLFAPPRKPGPAAGHRAGQGPGPRPGHRAAAAGPVQLRDLRPAGRRGHPAEPHLGRGDPHRGGVRPAAAPPGARGQHHPGHPRPGHQPARRAGHRLRHLAGPAGHHPGRAAARAVPTWCPWTCPPWPRAAGYPGTRVIPAVSWLLSLLALKLTRTRRVSHVDDLLADPAAALFAGLAVLPKKSALTSYSYRLSHDHQQRLPGRPGHADDRHGLATSDEAIFDLDFHAVMHWGRDPALEKHYVPTRSQRARSVLTFFAQDTGTHNLVYANADTLQGHPGPRGHRVLRPLEEPSAGTTRRC